jgi:hypothetical protein
MQQLTGVNAYIAQMGFVTHNFNSIFGRYAPAIMGVAQFFAALISMYYLYRIDRKKMIFVGNLGMCLMNYAMGIAFLFINNS